MKRIFIGILALLLSYITLSGMTARFLRPDPGQLTAPAVDQALADDLVAKIQSRNFAGVRELAHEKLVPIIDDQRIQTIAKGVPSTAVKSRKFLKYRSSAPFGVTGDDSVTEFFRYEYEFEDSWLAMELRVDRVGEVRKILGFRFYPNDKPLIEVNRMVFDDAGAFRILMAVIAFAIGLFVLWTLWICWRTPIVRRKWIWLLFVATGVGRVSFNWIQSTFKFDLLSATVPVVSIGGGDPYIQPAIVLSIPLGAIAFWILRKKIT